MPIGRNPPESAHPTLVAGDAEFGSWFGNGHRSPARQTGPSCRRSRWRLRPGSPEGAAAEHSSGGSKGGQVGKGGGATDRALLRRSVNGQVLMLRCSPSLQPGKKRELQNPPLLNPPLDPSEQQGANSACNKNKLLRISRCVAQPPQSTARNYQYL